MYLRMRLHVRIGTAMPHAHAAKTEAAVDHQHFFLSADCPGTSSEEAGKSSACQGCPNQAVCASAPKGPDPGVFELAVAAQRACMEPPLLEQHRPTPSTAPFSQPLKPHACSLFAGLHV